MNIIRQILFIIAAPLFIISISAYAYIEIRLKKKVKLDDIYYEFQQEHPVYKHYEKWSRFFLALASLSVLILFIIYIL